MSARGAALRACAVASVLAMLSSHSSAKPHHGAARNGAAAHRPPAASVTPSRSERSAKPARAAKVRHPTAPHQATRRTAHKAAPAPARPTALAREAARLRRASLPLVMIDPGHGGRDSGAVGATGLLEKDVTLATALELQRELRASGRYRVELTRTADVGISLANRLARAKTQRPALLISIHADASADPRAHGASVYVRAEPLRGETVKLPASPAASGAISRALSTGTADPPPGASWLQNAVVEQLRADVAMVHDPAREAHLYVLATTNVPSVLVEMGYVSNRHEERLLRTLRYRRTVAIAIRDAIGDYFDKTMYTVASGP